MNYYLSVLKKYAVFVGRAQRAEYWYFFLVSTIFGILLMIIDGIIGGNIENFSHEAGGVGLLGGIYSIAVLIPHIAVSVRRLHDTNHSGWWLFIGLVPFIGVIILLVFMALDSKPGENQYGPNPKGVTADSKNTEQ